MKNVLWICGWASDLSPWLEEIQLRLPGHHQILPFDQWFTKDSLPQADLILSWSLGYHAPIPSHIPHLAICPAVDFCGPGGWKKRIVERMIQQLDLDPRATLQAFAQNLGASLEDQERWLQNAHRMPIDLLKQGLQALQNPAPKAQAQWILTGALDQICLRGQYSSVETSKLKILEDCAHWPLHPHYLKFIESWISHATAL